MKHQLNEVARFKKLAGLLRENDMQGIQQAEKVANKVEDSLEAKVSELSPEQIEKLKAELANLGITAQTSVEDIAQHVGSALQEAEGNDKQKLANTLDNIGTGLIGSLLVPFIPVAIGSTGIGVAAGFGITLAAAGLLKGLAKALR